jgi:TolA-binding protein
MSPKSKLALYLVLSGCLAFFGYQAFQSANDPAGQASVSIASNAVAASNAPAVTNAIVVEPPAVAATNQAAATNFAESTKVPAAAAIPPDDALTPRQSSARLSRMMGFGAAALLALVGLAILISQDVSRFLANRVDQFIFNDDLEGVKDPEYDEAEEVWRKGQHLEAIRLMREYLKRHPREQYVALRIAEIYESDLRNPLAAALEYEEILKKRLPAERWGWAAIHLANLYSGKLNKSAEAEGILRRIVEDYGQTAAARKARERLGIPEPVTEAPAPAAEPEPSAPAEKKPAAEESNLPPGFRPK